MVIRWKSVRKRKMFQMIIPPNFYYTGFGKNKLGFSFTVCLQIIDHDWYESPFDADNFDEIGKFFLEKVKKDKHLLEKLLRESNEIAFQFLEFCRDHLNEENLKKETDKKLIEYLYTYMRFYEEYSAFNVSPWVFLSDKLFDELKSRLKEEDVIFLSTIAEPSYSSRFDLALLRLILKVKQKNIKLDSFEEFSREIKNEVSLENELNSIVKRYFWIPFEYIGPEMYNQERIFKMIKENKLSVEELNLRIDSLVHEPFILEEKQKESIRRLNLDEETIYLLECLKKLATLQDIKKAYTTESHFYLKYYFKELARRNNVDFMLFYSFLPEEIEEFINSNEEKKSESLMKRFEERKRMISVADTPKNKTYILVGGEADKFLKENNLNWPTESRAEKKDSFIGSSVSLGYTVGKARVLNSVKEMNKVQEGDIVIATMTTPDYVPAMKRASAIITEEGGITCHAAIVSRELKIPCIIAIENATSVFHDDDLVEVDARTGKGTIRKLSFEEFNRLSEK